MNSVILMGRLVADPELKTTQSGLEVTSFRIAVDRPYKQEGEKKADFIDVVAWRKTAAFICRYFDKGKPIIIQGSLQTRSYDAKDGSKRFVTEVLADNVEFVLAPKSNGNQGAQSFQQTPTVEAPPLNMLDDGTDRSIDINLDDDLPF